MEQKHQPIKPRPRRFLWLKRFALAALLLTIALAGLRLLWGQRVQARLDQAITDIQAKGEPILFADLKTRKLDDPDNGSWYLTQARLQWPVVSNTVGVKITDTDWYSEGEEAGFTDPVTDNAAYLASCKPVFDLLRQADAIEQSSWGQALSRPMLYILLPHLGESRELARLVDDAAKRAVKVGQTELVFDCMLMQHTIARHVQEDTVSLIDSLVAISIMSMNREFIEQSLPKIDPAQLREGPARDKAEEMIQRLTDGMLNESLIKGMISERLINYDLYECLIDGTDTAANLIGYGEPIEWMIDTPGLSYIIRPALKNEQYENVVVLTKMIEGLQNGTSFTDIQDIEAEFEEKVFNNRILYPLQGMLFGSYSGAIRAMQRNEVLQRCAAIAIAIKLYQADHDGQRPGSLDRLVPNYLPAIPTDPYSKTGEPIRYNPAGVVPTIENEHLLNSEQLEQLKQQRVRPYPVLYSVGEDQQYQDGGWLELSELGQLHDNNRYNTYDLGGDIWFMLDAWPMPIFDQSDLEDDDDEAAFDEDLPF